MLTNHINGIGLASVGDTTPCGHLLLDAKPQASLHQRHCLCWAAAADAVPSLHLMDTDEVRGRQERIRSAKRALRQYRRRRADQNKRASRTLRASLLVQGVETPTILTQSFTATNVPNSAARESAVRATDKTRRRHSRLGSTAESMSSPRSQRSSRARWSLLSGEPGTPRGSMYLRRQSLMQLPPVVSRRLSAALGEAPQTPPTASPRRHSRHSRQFTISTRRESFEVMSGRPMDTSAPRRSRASMRFSALEPASLLFASQQFAHKPLPPIPQDGPGTPSDEDEDGGRLGALEKLEGRRSVAPQKRDPTPSWLLDDATKKRGTIPSWIADSAPKSTDDTLHTLVEEDEENESRRADTGASNLQRPTLRPLRLTSMNAQGTPVVGLPRTKTARRASGLAYYPDTPPHERACAATHKPASSRSAQSTNTSWPYTDPAGSLFSPDSTASCSPGATSIDSVDHTPRLKRPAEPQAERRALPDVELLAQRERHTQEVTALQRELEEVRHVTGSQLASVSAARDAAVARAEALAAEVREKDEQLLDTSGERDMYRDDISDWRSRCSALEQTIQSQQLRLKQECTWRQVATKRMQAMSRRLQSDAPTGYASDSSLSSTVSLDALEPMPDLPEMPSDDELGDWSQQVARQLSKHAAADPSSDPPLETVHLLQDMREQIMTLYAQLQLEQSNHRLTRAQLDERVAEAQAAAVPPAEAPPSITPPPTMPDATATPVAPSTKAERRRTNIVPDVLGPAFAAPSTSTEAKRASLFVPGDALQELSIADTSSDATTASTSPRKLSRQRRAFVLDERAPAPDAVSTPRAAAFSTPPRAVASQSPRVPLSTPPRMAHSTPPRAPLTSPPRCQKRGSPWATQRSASPLQPQKEADMADTLFAKRLSSTLVGLGLSSPTYPERGLRDESMPSMSPRSTPPSHAPTLSLESLELSTAPRKVDTPDSLLPSPHDTSELFAQRDSTLFSHAGADEAWGAVDAAANYEPYVDEPDVAADAAPWPDADASCSFDMPQHDAAQKDLEGGVVCDPSYKDAPAEFPLTAPVATHEDPEASSPDDEDAWVSDDEEMTPRPEFIPEWSFDQAVFEAARDVRVYELSGRQHGGRHGRRGARRVKRQPIEDFFGIFSTDGELLPPLPLPDYALDMPPVDVSKLAPQVQAVAAPTEAADVSLTPPAAPALAPAPAPRARSAAVRGESPPLAAQPLAEPWSPPSTQRWTAGDVPKAYTFEAPEAGDNTFASAATLFSQMFTGWKAPWSHDEMTPEIVPTDYDFGMPPPRTPSPPTTSDFLAPAVPAPSTPVPRSPVNEPASPASSGGLRYVKPNPMTRIPVPTPVWKLDFSLTTATPEAGRVFTI